MHAAWLFAAGVLLAATPAAAQQAPDGFKFSGSVRLRYETLDGQFRPGFRDGEDLVSIRTILSAEYRSGSIRVAGELYDSRAYDTDSGSVIGTGEVNTLEPVQAYVAADIAHPLGKGSSATLQAGRFMLDIGSRRLVAADEYRNTTNGVTGLRADVRGPGGTRATLFYVLPQIRLPETPSELRRNRVRLDRENFDTQLWGGLVTRPKAFGSDTVELGYVGFLERDAPGRATRDRRLHNIDVRVMRDPAPGKFDHEFEAIYQFGTIGVSSAANAARLDVSASFVHAELGYSFTKGWKPRLSVEFDRGSGDGAGRGYGRFDSLYGMRRADFAPAGLYGALTRSNLSTVGVRVEARPDKRSEAFVTARAMWLAARTDSFALTGVRDATGASGAFAGHQFEGRYRRWLVPNHLRAEVNAVWLAKRGVLRTAPNAPPHGDTHYLSLALIASF